jgi:hypothetical protein
MTQKITVHCPHAGEDVAHEVRIPEDSRLLSVRQQRRNEANERDGQMSAGCACGATSGSHDFFVNYILE